MSVLTDIKVGTVPLDQSLFPGAPASAKVHDGFSDEQAKKNTEAARQRRATKAQAKLEAFHEFFKVQVPKRSPSPPTVETQQPTRVASPPVVQTRPEPVEASTPTIQTPFKNINMASHIKME